MSNLNPRIPPQSDDAEKSVLGAILIDKEAIIDVAESLKAEMFYTTRHEMVYAAIVALYEARDPIDVVTVSEKLKHDKNLKTVGGMAYLSDLTNFVPSSANVIKYLSLIHISEPTRPY